MSIASEITRISGKVSDSFDAVVAKGGTVTSRKIADLPTAISSISGGEPYIPSYIAPKSNVNGTYKPDNTATSFSLDGATNIGFYALYAAFYNCTNLTSVDLSSLTTISSNSGMYDCFDGCTGLTSVGLSSLTTISGSSAMSYCFYDCTGLTSVDLSSLTTISGGNAMQYCFQGCTGLTSVDLSSLTTVSGLYAMEYCFAGCTGLTSIDLSSLTTISGSSAMQYCFYGCTGLTAVTIGNTTAIDFGSRTNVFSGMFGGCNQASGIDLYIATDQATLSTMTGYPKFG